MPFYLPTAEQLLPILSLSFYVLIASQPSPDAHCHRGQTRLQLSETVDSFVLETLHVLARGYLWPICLP